MAAGSRQRRQQVAGRRLPPSARPQRQAAAKRHRGTGTPVDTVSVHGRERLQDARLQETAQGEEQNHRRPMSDVSARWAGAAGPAGGLATDGGLGGVARGGEGVSTGSEQPSGWQPPGPGPATATGSINTGRALGRVGRSYQPTAHACTEQLGEFTSEGLLGAKRWRSAAVFLSHELTSMMNSSLILILTRILPLIC
jgi:hypothetical protein